MRGSPEAAANKKNKAIILLKRALRKNGNDGKQETEKTKQESIPPIHKTQIVTISDLPVKAQLLKRRLRKNELETYR
jgi:hypothetical protein